MKNNTEINNLSKGLGTNLSPSPIRRAFISFGDKWKPYICIDPMVMVKQCVDGGLFNDGQQTIIVGKGDYLVQIKSSIYKVKKEEFEELFIDYFSSRNNKLYAAEDTYKSILGEACFRNNRVIFEEKSFFKRLRFLFKGKLNVRVNRPLECWKDEH